MINAFASAPQIRNVNNFKDLVSTPFQAEMNAICWKRELMGDFSEIVNKLAFAENMVEITPEILHDLTLSKQGVMARDIILKDLALLKAHGASPVLNIISHYERDDSFPFFPTDVYSFHVDRSPIATDTFLCTYFGAPSEIVPNAQATQKVLMPEIRQELKKLFDGSPDQFDAFLTDYFFDLHYQPHPNANIVRLGIGEMWKLAVDHPTSESLPCLHRAPLENDGQKRLLLIC